MVVLNWVSSALLHHAYHLCFCHLSLPLSPFPSRQSAAQPSALSKMQGVAHQLLSACRFSHMSGNFLAAVATHHSLLSAQPEIKQWLLEAMQWAKASDVQRKDMQVRAGHTHTQVACDCGVCSVGVRKSPECVWSVRAALTC